MLLLAPLIIGPALAAAPAPTAATPELLAKAKQEGTVVWYTSIEFQTAERVAKAFEAAHPGVKVQVERNGCERLVQRLGQERGSNIKAADVVECSDMTALLDWKKQGWLAAFVPADVAKYAAEDRDPDGFFATDPPKKVAQGERPVAADGGEYLPLQMIEKGAPLALVYPTEGTPSIPGGAGIMVDAPHPNAARLFAIYLFSLDGQQLLADMAKLRSVHPEVKLPNGMKKLSEIKLMKADPAAQEAATAEIKKRYAEYFGL